MSKRYFKITNQENTMKKVFTLMMAFMAMAASAFAQEREISGTVIDGDTKAVNERNSKTP